MSWTLKFHKEFQAEFDAFSHDVQDELLAEASYVERHGPHTARPHVDTLRGSHFANMKELRFEAEGGEWRAAFAFDPKREAIVLIAANKSGIAEKQFYKALIAKADKRYAQHLEKLNAEEKTAQKAAVTSEKKGKKR